MRLAVCVLVKPFTREKAPSALFARQLNFVRMRDGEKAKSKENRVVDKVG